MEELANIQDDLYDETSDDLKNDNLVEKAVKGKFPADSYFKKKRWQNTREKYKNVRIEDLYQTACEWEIKGAYQIEEFEPERQLELIRDEIMIRTKITAHEIFKIGRLLIMARRICSLNKIRFQTWIRSNFDFSYDTGENFMHVYENCLGNIEIAVQIKPSILYKISAPSFPDELRNLLFDEGIITSIKSDELKILSKKFNEGGFNAISQEVENLTLKQDLYEQTQFVLDRCKGLLSELRNTKHRIMNKYGYYKELRYVADRELLPNADEINKLLLNGIHDCVIRIESAIEAAEKSLSRLGFPPPLIDLEDNEMENFL